MCYNCKAIFPNPANKHPMLKAIIETETIVSNAINTIASDLLKKVALRDKSVTGKN